MRTVHVYTNKDVEKLALLQHEEQQRKIQQAIDLQKVQGGLTIVDTAREGLIIKYMEPNITTCYYEEMERLKKHPHTKSL